MPVAEVLRRLGSREVSEWIAEFQIRADEERQAYASAGSPAGGRPDPAAATGMSGGPVQGREDVPFFGPEGPPGFWTDEERERHKREMSPAEVAAVRQFMAGPGGE